MDGGDDRHGRAVELERGGQRTVPKVERLARRPQVGRRDRRQAWVGAAEEEAEQREAVRVGAQPGGLGRQLWLQHGVPGGVVARRDLRLGEAERLHAGRRRRDVPAPVGVRLRQQRRGEVGGVESLQAGHVCGEGSLPVTHRQHGLRVDRGHDDIGAIDERSAVHSSHRGCVLCPVSSIDASLTTLTPQVRTVDTHWLAPPR